MNASKLTFRRTASVLARTLALPLLFGFVQCTGQNGENGTGAGRGGSTAGRATAGAAGSSGGSAAQSAGSAGEVGVGGTKAGSSGSAGSSGGYAGSSSPAGGAGGGAGGVAGTPGGGGGAVGTSGGAANGGAGAGGTGASAGSAGAGAGAGGSPTLPAFLLGADISSVQEAIDNGTRYADTDGTQKGILEILKAHGFNAIRLRTFVEPLAEYGYASCNSDEPYCDRDHTLEFGQEIKAAGLSFLLDFHYSDTWADPAKQVIPEAWRSANTIAARAELLKEYTVDVVSALVNAGARPDMVQVGNEITPGMLIHVPSQDTDCWGNNSTPASLTGSISNWDNLATLLKAGIEGVREVDPSIKIMLHIENTDDLNGARSWVSNARSRGVEFDVLGLSCYTEWQGQPSVWQTTFETLAEEFPELSFVVAEYNPERTRANQIMRELPEGRGLGTFFWEPTQSGAWGESLFSNMGGTLRANADDFAEFDAIRDDFGL